MVTLRSGSNTTKEAARRTSLSPEKVPALKEFEKKLFLRAIEKHRGIAYFKKHSDSAGKGAQVLNHFLNGLVEAAESEGDSLAVKVFGKTGDPKRTSLREQLRRWKNDPEDTYLQVLQEHGVLPHSVQQQVAAANADAAALVPAAAAAPKPTQKKKTTFADQRSSSSEESSEGEDFEVPAKPPAIRKDPRVVDHKKPPASDKKKKTLAKKEPPLPSPTELAVSFANQASISPNMSGELIPNFDQSTMLLKSRLGQAVVESLRPLVPRHVFEDMDQHLSKSKVSVLLFRFIFFLSYIYSFFCSCCQCPTIHQQLEVGSFQPLPDRQDRGGHRGTRSPLFPCLRASPSACRFPVHHAKPAREDVCGGSNPRSICLGQVPFRSLRLRRSQHPRLLPLQPRYTHATRPQ